MTLLQKIYNTFNNIQMAAAKILLTAMTLLVFGSALSRVFDYPLPWSLDLTLLLFAWFAFLAAAQASRCHAHNGVDILTRLLPDRVQQVIQIINNILIIGFLVIIGQNSFRLALSSAQRTITSLGISYQWIILACCLGCGLMTVIEGVNLCIKVYWLIQGKGENA